MLFFAGCSHMVEDFKKASSFEKAYTVVEEFESLDNDEFDPLLTKISLLKINPGHYSPKVPEGFELFPENKIFENNVL